eukprot:m.336977 g.336977  ORF g.336977 m.336977 type:complete len:539 (+) comp18006_c0_seq1:416-2032(+)
MKQGTIMRGIQRVVIRRRSFASNRLFELPVSKRFLSTTRITNERVLLLGSGRVAQPVVDRLAGNNGVQLTVASADMPSAEKLVSGTSANTVYLDANNTDSLKGLIAQNDLVISLLPPPMHCGIAQVCVEEKVNMLTTSYVSPELQALSNEAQQAGITILNETGLDPGIDHLAAMSIINHVKDQGGKIDSFVSYCGGLPAPDCADVPLQYKFSWSPRGVLSAGLNSATYLNNGQVVNIPSGRLFSNASPLNPEDYGFTITNNNKKLEGLGLGNIPPGRLFRNASPLNPEDFTIINNNKKLELEGYPNRNSLIYADVYGIPEAKTVLRGTIRYQGFSSVMDAFERLGLFNTDVQLLLQECDTITWNQLLSMLIHGNFDDTNTGVEEHNPKIKDEVHQLVNDNRVVDTMERLGMFGEAIVTKSHFTIIDSFCDLLQSQLSYKAGECDMVLLGHSFKSKFANGDKYAHTATLELLGTPHGKTAMEVTVGVPCSIAAELMLAGEVSSGQGVIRPIEKSIYEPMLTLLGEAGINVDIAHSKVQD